MALEIIKNDDFIEYFIFPQINDAAAQEDVILETILQQAIDTANSFKSNYIWHKDPFVLKARNRNFNLLNPEIDGDGGGDGGESWTPCESI